MDDPGGIDYCIEEEKVYVPGVLVLGVARVKIEIVVPEQPRTLITRNQILVRRSRPVLEREDLCGRQRLEET